MFALTTSKTRFSKKQDFNILDFDKFYYLDVFVKEELSKKELQSFLEFKIKSHFNLTANFIYFYTKHIDDSVYQVYAVKNKIFSRKKQNIITPKSLAFAGLRDNYYVLLLEENKSYLMLYQKNHFILFHQISFGLDDVFKQDKMQDLISFVTELMSHLKEDNQYASKADTLLIFANQPDLKEEHKYDLSAMSDSLKNKINFMNIDILDDNKFYKSININLKKNINRYSIYPNTYSFVFLIGCLFIFFMGGYYYLYSKNEDSRNRIELAEQFYNSANIDVKDYYLLNDKINTIKNDYNISQNELKMLTSHGHSFDISDILLNAFRIINKYNVYLNKIEIKTQNNRRYVFAEVMLSDQAKLKRYVNSSAMIEVEKMSKINKLFIYSIKVPIRP